jgi:hypothetical protein
MNILLTDDPVPSPCLATGVEDDTVATAAIDGRACAGPSAAPAAAVVGVLASAVRRQQLAAWCSDVLQALHPATDGAVQSLW